MIIDSAANRGELDVSREPPLQHQLPETRNRGDVVGNRKWLHITLAEHTTPKSLAADILAAFGRN